LAADVLAVASRMIREIGLLQGNRSLLLEAEQIGNLIERNDPTPWLVVHSASALMGDAVGTDGVPVVADKERYRYERWWAAAGVVGGFCRSPREILFGIDDERRTTLRRIADFGSDIPHIRSWVDLNVRWLDAMQDAPVVRGDSLPGAFKPLQWVGLNNLAERIRFCRKEIRQFSATSFSRPGVE